MVGGVVSWRVLDDAPYDASRPASSHTQARPAQAAEVLRELETALDRGDPETAAALAVPGDAEAAQLLGQVTEGAKALGLDVAMRYVDESGAVADDGSWTAAVETTWRLAGDTGTEPARAEVTVSFGPAGAHRVGIAGMGDPERGLVPVWMSGPVAVSRDEGIVVLVAGDRAVARAEADRYLRLAANAVQVVRRVLPAWRGPFVVEVPASASSLDRALDVAPGTTSGIAAVTVPADGAADTDSPVHVFVNPDVFARLRPTGAQVVLSHEAVHVATGAARSNVEPWLAEGFADYVALRDVDLPVSTIAAQILAQVRRDGVPAALPGPADFATGTSHLGATYESAWLACALLAQRGGEPALVALYEDVTRGAGLGVSLPRHFGLDEDHLTRLWQQRLGGLAG